jgi:hypothetical protein
MNSLCYLLHTAVLLAKAATAAKVTLFAVIWSAPRHDRLLHYNNSAGCFPGSSNARCTILSVGTRYAAADVSGEHAPCSGRTTCCRQSRPLCQSTRRALRGPRSTPGPAPSTSTRGILLQPHSLEPRPRCAAAKSAPWLSAGAGGRRW